MSNSKNSSRRRPYSETSKSETAPETKTSKKEEAIQTSFSMSEPESVTESESVDVNEPKNESSETQPSGFGTTTEKAHLEFYGSDLLRQRAPKVMEAAEMVIEDWKNDGHFEGLPVGNPFAQYVASRALQRAKKVEKKLEEKGVISMVKMGAAVIKAQIEEKLNKK